MPVHIVLLSAYYDKRREHCGSQISRRKQDLST